MALGYEYIAITDHSPHAASSRTLTTDAVKKQAQEIAALRERYPKIEILHGCEVDIMADGKLDFSDRILERFDIVLASLHERLGHSPEQLLSRYLTAMRHPLVTLITHPTNRIIPYRRGYDLDWDQLFAAAIETRTAVEIDGAPPHLDHPDRRCCPEGARDRGRRHRDRGQRLPSRRGARPADGPRRDHCSPRMGGAAPRPEHAAHRGRPRVHFRQARRLMRTAAAAAGVALLSFFLYHSTLLPGLDFGDTPSFQVMGGEPAITPRDGYPLYFAVGSVFVRATGDPAHGLNLASAVEAAAASGVIVVVAAELAGSLVAGIAAALLFAGSYTFWSQAVITEVYSLHALMVGLSLWLLLRWETRPTIPRLAVFFAVFAVGFGNHLSMVLLLPGYTLFLLVSAPAGWRSLFTPRIIGLATALAAIGALQYAWNIHSLWLAPVPPASVADAMRTFWFDVTKSDWRDTMMANVPRAMGAERLRMYLFDVTQQFGVAVPVVAMAGAIQLFRAAPRRAWLVAALFIVNVVFALTYNVGDSHVFFLPSHLMIALFAAPGLVSIGTLLRVRLKPDTPH